MIRIACGLILALGGVSIVEASTSGIDLLGGVAIGLVGCTFTYWGATAQRK